MATIEQIEEKIDQAAGDLTDEQTNKLRNYLEQMKENEKNISDRSIEAVSLEVEERIEQYKNENKEDN